MNLKIVPLTWGLLIGGIGVWTIFGMTSGLKYLIGPLCLFFGWTSIKAAIFMTEKDLSEVIYNGKPVSKEVEEKINRM